MSRIPPEWALHAATWTAWPRLAEEWGGDLAPARADLAEMIRCLAEAEPVKVLAVGEEARASAEAAIGDVAEILDLPYGDIWLRDTGPIFTREGSAVAFRFNGWGGKYVMPGDGETASAVAAAAGATLERHDLVLEGGGVDFDGAGLGLTTRQCLLNPNRNGAGWTEAKATAQLKSIFGLTDVIWLGDGLANDHTDGHVDNIARFVGPGRVVCMAPWGGDDPNAQVLDEIAATLESWRGGEGRRLEVIRIPGPGRVTDAHGDPIPASHMNFIIGNDRVIVPIYSASGDDALAALAPLFPGRKLLGLSAHGLIAGGGSFHCATQQQPKL